MLPPPMTTPAWTPMACSSLSSAATRVSVCGLIPNPPSSPQSASPLIFSSTRRYFSPGCAAGGGMRESSSRDTGHRYPTLRGKPSPCHRDPGRRKPCYIATSDAHRAPHPAGPGTFACRVRLRAPGHPADAAFAGLTAEQARARLPSRRRDHPLRLRASLSEDHSIASATNQGSRRELLGDMGRELLAPRRTAASRQCPKRGRHRQISRRMLRARRPAAAGNLAPTLCAMYRPGDVPRSRAPLVSAIIRKTGPPPRGAEGHRRGENQ